MAFRKMKTIRRKKSEPFWKNPPTIIREVQQQVSEMDISPVNSYAAVLLDRHGREFEKEAIRAVMSQS